MFEDCLRDVCHWKLEYDWFNGLSVQGNKRKIKQEWEKSKRRKIWWGREERRIGERGEGKIAEWRSKSLKVRDRMGRRKEKSEIDNVRLFIVVLQTQNCYPLDQTLTVPYTHRSWSTIC